MHDNFWINDFKVLAFAEDGMPRYTHFFPTKFMSNNEILNSLTRFSIYLLIILIILKGINNKFLFIPIILIILCVIMYKIDSKDNHQIIKCQRPTLNNPYMNVMLDDYIENPNRLEACSYEDPQIKKETDEYFKKNLFSDVDDIYSKKNSQRQFYTTPITTIPNDQNAFAQWCYGKNSNCKTDQDKCLKYEDVRYKQTNNFPILKALE